MPRNCSGCGLPFCSKHIKPGRHGCRSRRSSLPRTRTIISISAAGVCIALTAFVLVPRLWPTSRGCSYPSTPGGYGKVVGALVVTMQTVQDQGYGTPVHNSVIHLYRYSQGSLAELWSTTIPGWVSSVSFNDLNCDHVPEIVVMNKPAYGGDYTIGDDSLQVFENASGQYQQAFVKYAKTNMARAKTLDRAGGGGSLLAILHGYPYLVDYETGKKPRLSKIPQEVGSGSGLDVGDVNEDVLPDIVEGLSLQLGGFYVLENKGRGRFRKVFIQMNNPAVVDLKVADVDGDGGNEIVIASRAIGERNPPISLSVWKHSEEGYLCVWEHMGQTIRSVDVGDLNGDGRNVIVAGSEGTQGVSVWEYDATGKSYARIWAEDANSTVWAMYDISLRVCPVDGSGLDRIVAVGTDMNRSEMYLYVGRGIRDEEEPEVFWLWSGGTSHCPTLDVWPILEEG